MEVYTLEELRVIVDEAKAHHLKVACHAHGAQVVKNAIEAGCTTIEHGAYIDEEGLALMKEKCTVWVPTYSSVIGFLLPHDGYNSSASFVRGRPPFPDPIWVCYEVKALRRTPREKVPRQGRTGSAHVAGVAREKD